MSVKKVFTPSPRQRASVTLRDVQEEAKKPGMHGEKPKAFDALVRFQVSTGETDDQN